MPRNSTARKRIASAPSTTGPTTGKSKLPRQVEIIKKLQEHESYNKIEYYDPYPFQKTFLDSGANSNQRLLMAGSRIGKSLCGAFETALEVCGGFSDGRYPDWWEGKRYKEPIVAWCGGVSNESTRDILQAELLGAPGDPACLGTGAIPRANIITTERKPGVPNAISIVQVKHITRGTSYLYFKAYKMGPADALYAFKSRGFSGEIGVVSTYPNRSKVPPHKCVLGSHSGMPNRKKPFNSSTRNRGWLFILISYQISR